MLKILPRIINNDCTDNLNKNYQVISAFYNVIINFTLIFKGQTVFPHMNTHIYIYGMCY